jgi:hypothetical protein
MLHAMRMIISMKKGMSRCLQIRLIMEGTGLVVGTAMPIEAQQALAKLNLKIRCSQVSNLCRMHIS